MRLCPCCYVPLERVRYESLPVFQCPVCEGYLVTESRLEAIRRRGEYDTEELERQAASHVEVERDGRLPCAQCFSLMDREEVRGAVVMDVCRGCGVVWLDTGEIAVVQLLHESTDNYRSQKQLRDAYSELVADPERCRRFEERLAKMPDGSCSLIEPVVEELGDAAVNPLMWLLRYFR